MGRKLPAKFDEHLVMAMTQRARKLRKDSTFPERLLWSKIRGGKLGYKFNRQFPIGNYIVDFYCHEKSLVIEVDGRSHDFLEDEDVTREKHLISKVIGLYGFQMTRYLRTLF